MTYAIMTHDIKCYPFIYISYIYIYIFFFSSDFLIVKCNLQCREQAHFHCCYCSKTVIRKVQIIKHLQVCTKRQVFACLLLRWSLLKRSNSISIIKSEPEWFIEKCNYSSTTILVNFFNAKIC